MAIAYDVCVVTVAGTMVGNEFAVAAFVHPQISTLDGPTHARIACRMAKVLGKLMPLWYGGALVLLAGAAYEHRPVSSGPGLPISVAAILWVLTIVFTVMELVPINNRIARMNPEHPYDGWLADRQRWDAFHRVRVALLLIAVVLLLTGTMAGSIANGFH